MSSSLCLTPRASNLSNAEIFSINTPGPLQDYHFNSNNDIVFWGSATSPRLSGYASSDAYSLQPTPRASNFNEMDGITVMNGNTPTWVRSPVAGKGYRQASPVVKSVSPPVMFQGQGDRQRSKDVAGMFVLFLFHTLSLSVWNKWSNYCLVQNRLKIIFYCNF